jgi:mannose-6-phosphate isomerase class I
MPKKKELVIKDPQDQTTKELIQTIFELTKEVENLRQEKRWHETTRRVNTSFNKAAAQWNSVTLQGLVNIINPGYNFYINSGSIHYQIKVKEFEVQVGDTVMVFGNIAYHTAHDQESRDNGSMGVDTITIYPDRIVVIGHDDEKVILPGVEDYEID